MSTLTGVFTQEFTDRIEAVLNKNCPEGSGIAMKRRDLSNAMGFHINDGMDSVLGSIIRNGLLSGWEVRKGPKGGIYRSGEKAEKGITELPQEFLDNLQDTLNSLLGSNEYVSRDEVAISLGDKNLKNKISIALKLPEFSDFGSKVGKGGGIYRKSIDEAAEDLGEDLVNAMEESMADSEDDLDQSQAV